jgi:hypothetical protein
MFQNLFNAFWKGFFNKDCTPWIIVLGLAVAILWEKNSILKKQVAKLKAEIRLNSKPHEPQTSATSPKRTGRFRGIVEMDE